MSSTQVMYVFTLLFIALTAGLGASIPRFDARSYWFGVSTAALGGMIFTLYLRLA